jgi:hypothetical protein
MKKQGWSLFLEQGDNKDLEVDGDDDNAAIVSFQQNGTSKTLFPVIVRPLYGEVCCIDMVVDLDVENASFFPRQLDSEMKKKHKRMKLCNSVGDCRRLFCWPLGRTPSDLQP